MNMQVRKQKVQVEIWNVQVAASRVKIRIQCVKVETRNGDVKTSNRHLLATTDQQTNSVPLRTSKMPAFRRRKAKVPTLYPVKKLSIPPSHHAGRFDFVDTTANPFHSLLIR
ncbi:hypothetical protein [Planococcus sp. ISL-110]|uniref:hypothetical protein n=1 Tax=Planococcus sp. ISL-110 TaxID=2819167 RepID=UPI001BE8CA22|nr:hypothetical protein [Planococcus sp. ISL-110]MBT2570953.1 hypothetical protein [Planococcus sp. ISL-110]